MQANHHKEYEKAVKTVSQPVKEGEHFDSNLGGVNEMFDTIRSSTQVSLLSTSVALCYRLGDS